MTQYQSIISKTCQTQEEGIPLNEKVVKDLKEVGRKLKVELKS
ncbi:hypothetical protein [Fulvivirga sp. M361]|nr:hypothetical protein [Fulvivirga sp. M361]